MLTALAIVAFGLTSTASPSIYTVQYRSPSGIGTLPHRAGLAAMTNIIASECRHVVRLKKKKSQAYIDGNIELNSLDASGKRTYAEWRLWYRSNRQKFCQGAKQQLEKGFDMPGIELRK